MTTLEIDTVEKMATRVEELKSIETVLIQNLSKHHQIVDAERLLEALHERNVLHKMLEVVNA